MDDVEIRAPRRTADMRVDASKCPGWIRGVERPPAAGERVYTHEGSGVIVRVLGRTGAGRLLEVALDDGRKPPFFTVDGNVMVERVGRPAGPRMIGGS